MEDALLHVLHTTLRSEAEIPALLRRVRRASAADQMHSVLVLADLPDASAPELPGDAPMLKKLQSGIMAMQAQRASGCFLLVRKRTWDDAARLCFGKSQKTSWQETAVQLIRDGRSDVSFAAATVSPASLRERFPAVLFSELSLSCTPDTPARMLKALKSAPHGCVAAQVLERQCFPRTPLSRLCALSPFSLSSLRSAKVDRLRRKDMGHADLPFMLAAEALRTQHDLPPRSMPVAAHCIFVRRDSRTVPDFFEEHRRLCLHGSRAHAILPIVQLILLFLSALWGLPWLAAAALLPSEIWTLLHPKLLPGALLRLSLLPLTACVSFDALLCRMLSHSRLLRLCVPDALVSPQGCALFGAACLPVAFHGAQALVALLPVCLLWLAAPLIVPALDAPTIERIPLDGDQRTQLRKLAESAFFDCEASCSSPSLRMLTACAGCMLGLLEPDEAARQAGDQLGRLADAPLPAHGLAALFAAAQFLRERMGDCDAALRELPAAIEAHARQLVMEPSKGRLWAWLAAARQAISCPEALERIARSEMPEPHDLLFLPMQRAKASPVYPLSLPLTHPHTFLRRQLLCKDAPVFLPDPASRFLFLAAAALDHPFYALLERSPVTGPYAPLLLI